MSQRKIDLSTLEPQQILDFKKSTEEEVTHFTTSLAALNSAVVKLSDCIANIDKISSTKEDTQILVPLTSSLYVPGKIKDTNKFLVDVGTGYFVEKETQNAKKVYENKIEKLSQDSSKLKDILKTKNDTLNTLNLALRSKLIEQEKQQQQAK